MMIAKRTRCRQEPDGSIRSIVSGGSVWNSCGGTCSYLTREPNLSRGHETEVFWGSPRIKSWMHMIGIHRPYRDGISIPPVLTGHCGPYLSVKIFYLLLLLLLLSIINSICFSLWDLILQRINFFENGSM